MSRWLKIRFLTDQNGECFIQSVSIFPFFQVKLKHDELLFQLSYSICSDRWKDKSLFLDLFNRNLQFFLFKLEPLFEGFFSFGFFYFSRFPGFFLAIGIGSIESTAKSLVSSLSPQHKLEPHRTAPPSRTMDTIGRGMVPVKGGMVPVKGGMVPVKGGMVPVKGMYRHASICTVLKSARQMGGKLSRLLIF